MVTEGENEHAGGREVCCVHRALSVCLSLSVSLSAVELGSGWVGGSAGEFDSSKDTSESNLLHQFLRDLFTNLNRVKRLLRSSLKVPIVGTRIRMIWPTFYFCFVFCNQANLLKTLHGFFLDNLTGTYTECLMVIFCLVFLGTKFVSLHCKLN